MKAQFTYKFKVPGQNCFSNKNRYYRKHLQKSIFLREVQACKSVFSDLFSDANIIEMGTDGRQRREIN